MSVQRFMACRSTTVNIFKAQRELALTAKKACGSEEAHFGHYGFSISQPLAGSGSKSMNMNLTQDIRCGSARDLQLRGLVCFTRKLL